VACPFLEARLSEWSGLSAMLSASRLCSVAFRGRSCSSVGSASDSRYGVSSTSAQPAIMMHWPSREVGRCWLDVQPDAGERDAVMRERHQRRSEASVVTGLANLLHGNDRAK
jgi:hypothetical protein